MPRNVRNFWLDLQVDGHHVRIETGPASRDGGFDLAILQRHEGQVVRVGRLIGLAFDDGELLLSFEPENPPEARTETHRGNRTTPPMIRIRTVR